MFTLKKSFFGHNSLNIKISKKKDVILRSLRKIIFIAKEGYFFRDHFEKSFFGHNSLNIKVSKKKEFILRSLRKMFFWTKTDIFFMITMKKSFFGHHSLNINISKKIVLFFVCDHHMILS